MSEANENEVEVLRTEIEKLRAENSLLKSNLRIGPEKTPGTATTGDDSPAERPVRVLLLPDSSKRHDGAGPGPAVAANIARVLITTLRKRQPDVDWRAEHDLSEIPEHAACFQLGEVTRRMMGDGTSTPRTFKLTRRDSGQLTISRVIVPGEPESDQFHEKYERQIGYMNDLLVEGQAAHDASAEHHATWSLKAFDLVSKRAELGLAQFQAGTSDWKETLSAPRPEYDPRYQVTADMPIGY
jgi:hypothetical protein